MFHYCWSVEFFGYLPGMKNIAFKKVSLGWNCIIRRVIEYNLEKNMTFITKTKNSVVKCWKLHNNNVNQMLKINIA